MRKKKHLTEAESQSSKQLNKTCVLGFNGLANHRGSEQIKLEQQLSGMNFEIAPPRPSLPVSAVTGHAHGPTKPGKTKKRAAHSPGSQNPKSTTLGSVHHHDSTSAFNDSTTKSIISALLRKKQELNSKKTSTTAAGSNSSKHANVSYVSKIYQQPLVTPTGSKKSGKNLVSPHGHNNGKPSHLPLGSESHILNEIIYNNRPGCQSTKNTLCPDSIYIPMAKSRDTSPTDFHKIHQSSVSPSNYYVPSRQSSKLKVASVKSRDQLNGTISPHDHKLNYSHQVSPHVMSQENENIATSMAGLENNLERIRTQLESIFAKKNQFEDKALTEELLEQFNRLFGEYTAMKSPSPKFMNKVKAVNDRFMELMRKQMAYIKYLEQENKAVVKEKLSLHQNVSKLKNKLLDLAEVKTHFEAKVSEMEKQMVGQKNKKNLGLNLDLRSLLDENEELKDLAKNQNKALVYLKTKEVKLLKLLYIIKKEGIDIDQIYANNAEEIQKEDDESVLAKMLEGSELVEEGEGFEQEGSDQDNEDKSKQSMSNAVMNDHAMMLMTQENEEDYEEQVGLDQEQDQDDEEGTPKVVAGHHHSNIYTAGDHSEDDSNLFIKKAPAYYIPEPQQHVKSKNQDGRSMVGNQEAVIAAKRKAPEIPTLKLVSKSAFLD